MSGAWTSTKNWARRFGGQGASHSRPGAERRMGKNRDPYYGNGRTAARSGSAQLLGGG